MYHANLFPLTRHEPLPVCWYTPSIDPKPINKPQQYQILGIVAKQILYRERKPSVSSGQQIMSLSPISKLTGHVAEIPEVGRFNVTLVDAGSSSVGLDQFDQYRLLVNRLADIALTMLSSEYYKFHPEAPYILRDEPYFDADLIEKTGIIDSKKYYRGLHEFNNLPVFVLNRETELRSHKNLLNEIKSLMKYYELTRKTNADFYNPPKEFVDYVNFLLRGKVAEVISYPGPSVKEIKEVTWQHRACDITPGSTASHVEYLRDTYGVQELDPKQPLVVYEIGLDTKRIQYHVPEVLSIGHTFSDLEKRIPRWQRTQVWGVIHPDCKNQLQKIYGVLLEVDRMLRTYLPEIYPKLVEISTEAMDVTSLVSKPAELKLKFGNKDMLIKTPYDVNFYHSYTDKKLSFARPIENIRALVCGPDRSQKIKVFLTALAKEFKLRNNSELSFDYGTLDFDRTDYSGYDAVITIGSDTGEGDEKYDRCKEILQNSLGIIHQHVTEEHANEDSVMALVMEINLKFGGDPWLLPDQENIPCTVGIHSYSNPYSGKQAIFALALDGRGALLKQFDPVQPTDFENLAQELLGLNEDYGRILYVLSYDRFNIFEKLEGILGSTGKKVEYCIAEIDDQDYVRFFETWLPRKAPRFGKIVSVRERPPIEAYESAPQGVALKSDDDTFFLLTGKTIEKDATKRGCPMPIRLLIKKRKGKTWESSDIVNHVFALSMMGRASGHMTRLPSPLYYLQSYAYYWNRFGVPKDEKIRQRIFFI
ncbi:MAG TPA: hypothetical protein VJ249_09260 [Candidatus Bathyarchaeia archaeon]|nr:hypothetical protein [Candidatus Bathyarchaeia archaeon]